ncbi:UNVERIFIED_CONTAM: L-ascorbate oxidase [Sesamum radiatum]|uniref:L-ascorbate oxidase n=1 Tax=Sesamum radiatum TaxID=300843 RepID=A0AAW2P6L7_SESRA
MGRAVLFLAILAFWSVSVARAEDAYKYYTFTVTYGTMWVLGPENQQVILINGQLLGPTIEAVTNDNIIVNVVNKLDEPFLLTWMSRYTKYVGLVGPWCFQMQDVWKALEVSIYFSDSISQAAGDFTLLIGDWYHGGHQRLQKILDSGKPCPFLMDSFYIAMMDLPSLVIKGHKLKVVEVEGSHVLQNMYDSLDVHVGQSVTVLVTLDQPVRDYYIVASTRWSTTEVDWSINQARSFSLNSIPSAPSGSGAMLATSVMGASLHEFIEVVFQNNEDTLQSWHLDGYDFWVVGFGSGQWTEASRKTYNLVDALTRHTTQVYPKSWTAILVSLDNQGMWNIRSAIWGRQYLGQQFYLRVYNPNTSLANEYNIPSNALVCGKAVGHRHP